MTIERVAEFVRQCPALDAAAKLNIDYTEPTPTNYGIMDLGKTIAGTDIAGKHTYRHSYLFHSIEYTSENDDRIMNTTMINAVQDWINEQERISNYPRAENKELVTKIQAVNAGYYPTPTALDKGLYQLQFYITYMEVH